LDKNEGGYFSAIDPEGRAGDTYTFTVDGVAGLADLASRFQPRGLAGPSMVIDPAAYRWQATTWKRPAWQGQVVYELHVGTFTREGTYTSAIERLDHLAALGITVVELMPLAESTGGRNWGYDGVLLFAPYHPYGTPDELRAFIDACHLRGLAVMLDVVYNHIGAVGDVTDAYSKYLSHAENAGPWGKSFNLHGEHSAPVRQLLLQNIEYWLKEFRFDGFRLDATHAIRDESEEHLVALISERIHAHGAFVIAEDERNTSEILQPRGQGGWQLDGVWADDFHHTLRVSQTRETHSYLGRYTGSLEEIADTLTHGWFFRGQPHPKLEKPRGTACAHLPPERFVCCISNHDQVGNRPFGERLHHILSPEASRALSLFFCLIPYTPMLFMGQEWSASSPFLYFTDHPGDFGRLVTEGRAREFQFQAGPHGSSLPDCQALTTFGESQLKWDEVDRSPHREVLALYREGLSLRRKVFGRTNPPRSSWRARAGSDHVCLSYELPDQVIAVTLRPSGSDPREDSGTAQVLLRSNDARFGGDPAKSGPETIVSVIPSTSI
jgi:maltooligosyltrehalose trehalohydrolase